LLLTKSIETVVKKNLDARTYVELGVYRAKTSPQIENRLDGRHTFVGVDIWFRSKFLWRRNVGHKSKNHGPKTKFFLATTEDAANAFDGPCAWIFIDACHCFDCASNDIRLWGKKLVAGGHLVMHDTSRTDDELATKRQVCRDGRVVMEEFNTNFIPPGGAMQHGGKRPYGVRRAVAKSEFLKNNFRLLWETDDLNGLQVYERI